jgi:rfaE bifunctional protein kinase chain/domain
MVKLTGVFSRIGNAKVMVVGDLLLDTYTIGKARRISPEAPVAVVNVLREEHRPGGAGNVVLNLISLGASVSVLGRIGHDIAGETLKQALLSEGIDVTGIVTQASFKTPVKNRIIAENQQIVRVDHETVTPIPEVLEKAVIGMLPKLLQGISVVAISDYGKGFLSKDLLRAIIEQSRELGIAIIADPKGIEFSKYSGTTVLKPNLGEAYAAANLPTDAPLDKVAERILALAQADVLMVTRSEAGISLFYKDGSRQDFPVRVREVKDVTGAGDTVLAMLACAMANGLPISTAAQLSNVAAGIAIEHFGCARVTLSELARRLLEDDVDNKVFDGEHLFALQEALRGRRMALLSVEGTKGLTASIFKSIRKLCQDGKRDLLVYVRDEQPDEDFVRLLSSLREVSFILLQVESLQHLYQVAHPEEICLVENDDCIQLTSMQELLC